MTVEVSGVAQDGTTTFINSRVHNRTRTLTCAGVSGLGGPWSVMLRDPQTCLESDQGWCGKLASLYAPALTNAQTYTHACTHVDTLMHTHAQT